MLTSRPHCASLIMDLQKCEKGSEKMRVDIDLLKKSIAASGKTKETVAKAMGRKLVEEIRECTSNRCKVWGEDDYNILKLLVVMVAKLCECTPVQFK